MYGQPSTMRHNQIEKLACQLWEERGRPLGSSEEDWTSHDEEANRLALNLMHDIVRQSVQEACDYYAKEFLDYRLKEPTLYMDEPALPAGEQCWGS